MVQSSKITFYMTSYSPFCHRVHIALEETHAKYTLVDINLKEKPTWFTEKVNTAGVIPALTYGPEGAPEDPAPGTTKLYESLVIAEFLADLFPEAKLLPEDPAKRAEARLIITIFESKVTVAFRAFARQGESSAQFLEAIAALQARLAPSGFAVGEFSLADVAIAPQVLRLFPTLENEYGRYPVGEGKKLLEALRGPKYARFMQYVEDLAVRPSVKATYDEAGTLAAWKKNTAMQRN